MPTTFDRVLLFPGQGAFRDGELPQLAARHPQVRQVFAEIDCVANDLGAEGPGPHVLTGGPRPLEQLVGEAADILQLAIYGTSIALWRLLRDSGQQSGMLAGHSSGEIAALVAGGAFTVAQGAEIVVHRSAVLAGLEQPPGGMLALACDAERARRMLDTVGNPLVAVAVRNGPRQVVLSGPVEALEIVEDVARALQVGATALTVAYPFHSPMLAEAVPEFATRIGHIEPRPLRSLVFSPILGRFHRAEDALGEHLACALVAPVAFDRALDRLRDAGARTFVECATAGTLTRIVRRCLPETSAVPALVVADLDDVTPAPRPRAGIAEMRIAAAPAQQPVAVPAAVAASAVAATAGRGELFDEIVAIYAQALEYPAEVFTEDVMLEEDLGIDSVKQTELMARLADQYGLPEPAQDFRLGDYDTMAKLVDYVWATRDANPPAAHKIPPAQVATPGAAVPVAATAGRGELFDEIVAIYAQALEYPAEVFTEDVMLEEDLGIDSVKQTELMARLADQYGLPEPAQDFRLGDYDTMAKLVDYVWATRTSGYPAARRAAA